MAAIATLPRLVAAPLASPRRAPLHVVTSDPHAARPALARLAGVVLLALVVALAVGYLVQADPGPVAGDIPVLADTHVVSGGETMWSIASDVAPAGEAAGYVERLVEVNGSASVTPGQVLALPVP